MGEPLTTTPRAVLGRVLDSGAAPLVLALLWVGLVAPFRPEIVAADNLAGVAVAAVARAARARLEQRFSWARVARQFEDICLRAMDARVRRPTPSIARASRLACLRDLPALGRPHPCPASCRRAHSRV